MLADLSRIGGTAVVRLSVLWMLMLLSSVAAPATDEFTLVNALRAHAGLPALAAEPTLAKAAVQHARYLDRHREPGQSGQGLSAHTELATDAGFSGAMPADRALAAGYPHREVLENLSMGYADATSAIDGLMSAIYHRLTFLDLTADQLGVAVGEHSRVFLLGRADLTALCRAPPREALYRTPLDCIGQPMTRDYYEARCAELPAEALFRPSHPFGCANGTRLDAGFMAAVCARPPAAARFRGHGRYYAPCDNGQRLDADWFDGVCARPPRAALYTASGTYFEICEPPVKVGGEWFEALCANLPEEARYRDSWRYRKPCADDTEVRSEYLDTLDREARATRPEAVLWPPPGTRDVPPAFFIEQPDPLPDRAESGYPISVQFNPARVGIVTLREFRLYRVEHGVGKAVEAVRLLDHDTDPNHLLTAFEFALFPLERLAWGTAYRVEIDAVLDGQPRRFRTDFTTREAGYPVLTADAERQRFVVRSGVEYLLYLPPQGDQGGRLDAHVTHRRGNQVHIETLDPRTLRLRIEARHCDLIQLQFDQGRRLVELLPAGCAG